MYQPFDLITEHLTKQGNKGAATLVTFFQSLQALINALSPGAYSSVTKINFRILDDLLLKTHLYLWVKGRNSKVPS